MGCLENVFLSDAHEKQMTLIGHMYDDTKKHFSQLGFLRQTECRKYIKTL